MIRSEEGKGMKGEEREKIERRGAGNITKNSNQKVVEKVQRVGY